MLLFEGQRAETSGAKSAESLASPPAPQEQSTCSGPVTWASGAASTLLIPLLCSASTQLPGPSRDALTGAAGTGPPLRGTSARCLSSLRVARLFGPPAPPSSPARLHPAHPRDASAPTWRALGALPLREGSPRRALRAGPLLGTFSTLFLSTFSRAELRCSRHPPGSRGCRMHGAPKSSASPAQGGIRSGLSHGTRAHMQ